MAEASANCVVRDVKLKNNNLGPVIVNFEHGSINGENSKNLRCGVYSNNGNLVVAAVAKEGDILYQGCLEDKNDLCRTVLAIKEKNSNKVRLIEASCLLLSPRVASTEAKDTKIRNKQEASMDLSLAFGSKKSKRMADQRQRMSVNVDAIKHKASSLIEDIQVDDKALEPSNDNSLAVLLPPCNRSALTISAAYPIGGILSDDELSSLKSIASQYADGTLKSPKMSLFCEHLAAQIKSDHIKNLALLLYTQSLIEFLSVKPDKILSSKRLVCPYSDVVWNRIVRDFMSSGLQKARTSSMEDKAIAYIMILNFHIGNMICDVDRLTKSIKCRNLNMTRIKFIASVVGAAKHSDAAGHVLLVFPLRPLPVHNKVSASKRRR